MLDILWDEVLFIRNVCATNIYISGAVPVFPWFANEIRANGITHEFIDLIKQAYYGANVFLAHVVKFIFKWVIMSTVNFNKFRVFFLIVNTMNFTCQTLSSTTHSCRSHYLCINRYSENKLFSQRCGVTASSDAIITYKSWLPKTIKIYEVHFGNIDLLRTKLKSHMLKRCRVVPSWKNLMSWLLERETINFRLKTPSKEP